MTVFESLIVIILGILAAGVVIIICKGGFTIRYEKHIVEEKKPDPIQLELTRENLKELKRYNDNAENAAKEQTETVRSITSAIQEIMGVGDDERR